MNQSIHHTVCADIGGNEQRVHSIQTDWSGLTFKHLLLPVWIGAYRFQGKIYQVVVNARTGEVHGERPWSVAKLALLAALVLAVILFVVWMSN
jgi:fatty acid desaturase